MVDKCGKALSKLLQIGIAVIIFMLVALNSVQVVMRYAMGTGFVWANDFQIYCLYVIVSMAIPYLWLERKHVCMDYADKIFPPKVLSLLEKICDVWAGVVAVLMFISASKAFQSNKGMVTNALGYDESMVYVPFMVCAVVWLVAVAIDLYKRVKEEGK